MGLPGVQNIADRKAAASHLAAACKYNSLWVGAAMNMFTSQGENPRPWRSGDRITNV